MTSAHAQLAPAPAPPRGRALLPHLLHALNQPLTGLQCSLELAVAGPRRSDQYVRTLREGLTLASRMRILVEAIRELTDLQQEAEPGDEPFYLDGLLRETVDDLRPVCQARNLELSFACDVELPVRNHRAEVEALLFRFLESVVSLAHDGSPLCVTAARDQERAAIAVTWTPAPPFEFSPFSRPELGLLIAQAGWERAGAEWAISPNGNIQTCTVRVPLSPAAPDPVNSDPVTEHKNGAQK